MEDKWVCPTCGTINTACFDAIYPIGIEPPDYREQAWQQLCLQCDTARQKPAPGLSPDMLSEEDREQLATLKAMASFLASHHYLRIEESLALDWAHRLLADNHGEG